MSDLKIRIALEKFGADLAVSRAIELGFYVSVNDGEEIVVSRSQNKKEILESMFSTDEDILIFYKKQNDETFSKRGVAIFTYGNDGYDVISDYSDNPTVEDILATANSVYDAWHAGKIEIELKFKE